MYISIILIYFIANANAIPRAQDNFILKTGALELDKVQRRYVPVGFSRDKIAVSFSVAQFAHGWKIEFIQPPEAEWGVRFIILTLDSLLLVWI